MPDIKIRPDYVTFDCYGTLLDRGYDPPSPSYGYVRVESLDELNALLGL